MGNLAPGTYTEWVSVEDSVSASALSLTEIRKKLSTPIFTACNEKPSFYLCDPTTYDRIYALLGSSVQFITEKGPLLAKFIAAYKETIDFMYSDPKALEIWSKWTNVPLDIATGMRDEFFPKKNLELTRVSGLDEAMADAVSMKFLTAPLTKAQLDDMLKYYAK